MLRGSSRRDFARDFSWGSSWGSGGTEKTAVCAYVHIDQWVAADRIRPGRNSPNPNQFHRNVFNGTEGPSTTPTRDRDRRWNGQSDSLGVIPALPSAWGSRGKNAHSRTPGSLGAVNPPRRADVRASHVRSSPQNCRNLPVAGTWEMCHFATLGSLSNPPLPSSPPWSPAHSLLPLRHGFMH